jgi:hypothetical protein
VQEQDVGLLQGLCSESSKSRSGLKGFSFSVGEGSEENQKEEAVAAFLLIWLTRSCYGVVKRLPDLAAKLVWQEKVMAHTRRRVCVVRVRVAED